MCSGKAEKLCFRKKCFYGIVVISELGTMAFIKNNSHSLSLSFSNLSLKVSSPFFFFSWLRLLSHQGLIKLLDGGNTITLSL